MKIYRSYLPDESLGRLSIPQEKIKDEDTSGDVLTPLDEDCGEGQK